MSVYVCVCVCMCATFLHALGSPITSFLDRTRLWNIGPHAKGTWISNTILRCILTLNLVSSVDLYKGSKLVFGPELGDDS